MKQPSRLVKNSRLLRKNATAEENKLWYQFLNKLSVRFWRQKVIGSFIVDFCCPSIKLVVELDGAQHYEDENVVKDKQRDDILKSLGYRVLRYTNQQINLQFEAVCQDIYDQIYLEDN